MFSDDLISAATALLAEARDRGFKIATAESCTGGLIIGLLTEIAGSSDVVDRGFVTYSNAAKQDCLAVPEALLVAHGAVSAEVACAMAQGAINASAASVSVAVTGVAGPGGGSPHKPVGLVHLCAATRDGALIPLERRYGDIGRGHVRLATVVDAIALLRAAVTA